MLPPVPLLRRDGEDEQRPNPLSRALRYEQWPPHCLHRALDAPVARGVRGRVGVKDV